VYLNNSAVTAWGCIFCNCSSTLVGRAIAAVYDTSEMMRFQQPLVTVTGSTFVKNVVNSPGQSHGSAVGVIFDSIPFNDTHVVFAKNIVKGNMVVGLSDSQGAFAILYTMNADNNSVTSTQNIFEGNNATTTQGNCYGGALSMYYLRNASRGTLLSTSDQFHSNGCTATQGNAMGGAVALRFGEDGIDNIAVIQGGDFSNNTVSGHYSAIGERFHQWTDHRICIGQ
jgi:hypothetical protein